MKIVILLKRRADITHSQFREHYEKSHVELAKKYLGHLFTDYRRNYPIPTGTPVGEAPNPGLADSAYDAITEIWLRNEAAWIEMQRIVSDPKIGGIFMKDEENFLDRPALRIFACEEVKTSFPLPH
jgi:hypothetical protein